MKKISFFRVLLLLMMFSAFAKANGTGITPLCGGCPPPPPPPSCTECVENRSEIFAPDGFNSFEHRFFFIWELPDELQGKTIVAAGITFYGIDDWRPEYGDKLYIRLLNEDNIEDARTAKHMQLMSEFSDNPNVNGLVYQGKDGWIDGDHDDDLRNYGQRIGIYEDKVNGSENKIFCFTDDVLAYLNESVQDGVIGIGLDPDCWYRFPYTETDNIKFWYCTTTIPAPGAVLLGGIGVCLVGWLRRRRTL